MRRGIGSRNLIGVCPILPAPCRHPVRAEDLPKFHRVAENATKEMQETWILKPWSTQGMRSVPPPELDDKIEQRKRH